MPGSYEVELRVPADMSWALEAQRRVRSELATAARPGLLPAVEVAAGSGSGELVLRWVELQADGAWLAARTAVDTALELLPELAAVPFLRVSADHQDPDLDRRRPRGA